MLTLEKMQGLTLEQSLFFFVATFFVMTPQHEVVLTRYEGRMINTSLLLLSRPTWTLASLVKLSFLEINQIRTNGDK